MPQISALLAMLFVVSGPLSVSSLLSLPSANSPFPPRQFGSPSSLIANDGGIFLHLILTFVIFTIMFWLMVFTGITGELRSCIRSLMFVMKRQAVYTNAAVSAKLTSITLNRL